jgi:hypothetical protein
MNEVCYTKCDHFQLNVIQVKQAGPMLKKAILAVINRDSTTGLSMRRTSYHKTNFSKLASLFLKELLLTLPNELVE